MTVRTASTVADLQKITNADIAAQTVVALPPSTLDPALGKMRVYVDDVLLIRDFDPVMEQP